MAQMRRASRDRSTDSVRRSTTSGMIDRKKIITFGLPSVSDRAPRNARQPRDAVGAASPFATGAVAIFQAT